jgi:alginate O-acetyltransferase complex protein AlgI
MLFNSAVFLFLFLPITYAVFWALRTANQRYVWLAITGYVFYGYWDPRFCLLMAFSTVVSYLAGLGFLHCTSTRARTLLLVIPVAVDLSVLAFFKYAMFVLDNLSWIASAAGVSWHSPEINIILPVGISFYTFHTISYIVDCYRRVITPTRNLFEFAAYVSLFSQLVAGPIVRFRQIEDDLEALGIASRTQWLAKGIYYFLWGLVEKVVVADALAAWVDPALLDYRELSSAATWMVMVGYSLQLYFDFCGYSNMAIGLGYMFGMHIPINFNSPYKSTDPAEFWRRWHISLSTCMRDYLYIPMGGSKVGEVATYRNLMVTMLIGGLWHGANWTFVVWGAFHGVLLIAHRAWAESWACVPRLIRWLLMMLAVLVGWVFFRATSIEMALHMLGIMFAPRTGGMGIEQAGLFGVAIAIATLLACIAPNATEVCESAEWTPSRGFVCAGVFGACIAIILSGNASPFLYFQF